MLDCLYGQHLDLPAPRCCAQVVVRVRPVLPSEIQQGVAVTCSPDGSRVQVRCSPEQVVQLHKTTAACCHLACTFSVSALQQQLHAGPVCLVTQQHPLVLLSQVMVPQRAGEKEQLPGAARAGAKSFKFDACLPGSTTQVRCSQAVLVAAGASLCRSGSASDPCLCRRLSWDDIEGMLDTPLQELLLPWHRASWHLRR